MSSEPTTWTVESAEAWIASLLPEPVVRSELQGDAILLQGGDPGLVVVRLKPAAIRIGVFTQRWWGARGVLVDETLVALPWGRLPSDLAHAKAVVKPLIESAIALRRSRFFECERCAVARPPEWRHANRGGPDPCRMCGFDGP